MYGFGPQPFGDARFPYSSQAPFHMGFFHESAVVYAAAGFLQRSWPDWRAYQYMGLARLAFATGHPYWAYRFLGWGLHHVQDLTQPYHAKPLPGVELASLLVLAVGWYWTTHEEAELMGGLRQREARMAGLIGSAPVVPA